MAKAVFQEPAAKMDVYISADSFVKGHLQTKSNIKVDGRINGNINAAGNVHVGTDAQVDGNVTGTDVQIAGIVRGNINVSGALHIFSSAKLIGDVKAASVEVEKGAQYKGNMAIGGPIEEAVANKDAVSDAAVKVPAAVQQGSGKEPEADVKAPAGVEQPAEKAVNENGREPAKIQPINVFKGNHNNHKR